MNILFYDPITPIAYDASTLMQQGLGGTEATLIRIAEGLKNNHTVYIAQHCRQPGNDLISQDIHYLSFESAHRLNPDAVILLRTYKKITEIANIFPNARKFLWLHNMPSSDLYTARDTLVKHSYKIIAVSNFHRDAIQNRLNGKWLQNIFRFGKKTSADFSLPIYVLYNPINDSLEPDSTLIKPNQLLFMSSPNKGLPQTLRLFEKVLTVFPNYQLLIANPGYNHMDLTLPAQANFMGVLPHHQVISTLRESFCVFYPQQERMETFGLIYAEANAVGTPVLAHDFGAAKEVLSDASQAIDCRKISNIIGKLSEWRANRPTIHGKNEFKLSHIIKKWNDLLHI